MSLKVNSKTRNKDRKTKEELAAEKALAELRNLPRNPLDLELNELHVALNFNEVRKLLTIYLLMKTMMLLPRQLELVPKTKVSVPWKTL